MSPFKSSAFQCFPGVCWLFSQSLSVLQLFYLLLWHTDPYFTTIGPDVWHHVWVLILGIWPQSDPLCQGVWYFKPCTKSWTKWLEINDQNQKYNFQMYNLEIEKETLVEIGVYCRESFLLMLPWGSEQQLSWSTVLMVSYSYQVI